MNPCCRRWSKIKTLEVHVVLFKWSVDVRTTLSARLPKSLFLLKARELYEDWLNTPDAENLYFSKFWMKNWQKKMVFHWSFLIYAFPSPRQMAWLEWVSIWKIFWVPVAIFLNRLVLIPLLLMGTKFLFTKMRAANK